MMPPCEIPHKDQAHNLPQLQSAAHAQTCLTRAERAGEDQFDFGATEPAEWCTCGLTAALVAAGDRSRR
jgi:hypothetical protein